MTAETEMIEQGLREYIVEHTIAEDDFLKDLKRSAEAEDIPRIWISPEQAALMHVILRLAKAREVIEVGTLAGYAAICMARALPENGRVQTIELEDKHADFAERWISKSDVSGKIDVLRGAGDDVLAKMADNSADAIFIDADKESYKLYVEHAARILRPGGMIMIDNAFAFGQLLDPAAKGQDVQTIREVNEMMARRTDFVSVLVHVSDGLWLGVKVGG